MKKLVCEAYVDGVRYSNGFLLEGSVPESSLEISWLHELKALTGKAPDKDTFKSWTIASEQDSK